MTTVVNKYKVNMSDSDIVYIGRGSPFGNPFKMYNEDARPKVIELYRHWLWEALKEGKITKQMLLELDGKRLACYCAPKACHGDVLVKAIDWVKGELK